MKEEKIIEQLKERNTAVFSQLIDDYQQKVFGTCISFVPNKEDAEDLVQEVFLEVYNSISKFKGNSKLSTWIYKITTNKCLEFIRKKNTKKRSGFLKPLFSEEFSIDKTNYFTEFNHPGFLLENKELNETLFKAINSLPESQASVFTLHKIDGKSYQEIADITDKSVSSVESLMFRAKKNLQQLLYDYYKNEI
ncbi:MULTISPECIES: RNA polymerase sigma factor [Winogradskyella]|uniref:RNA polymerase sigma factor n=1 Tax=Winogradskyella marincola TaxID=3037795 RepID=A0ABT6G3L5_9FLAO|nr:RNA polymerase sigma factor [Winogradskyella sp. YYF002]MDG4716633.1 RNA polymerase sigma factor [Winogradskyella sp. YYF002]